jgi:hypothetical protein
LLGHKAHSIASRYLHSADTVLLAAADDDPGRSGSGHWLAGLPASQ